MIKQRGKGRSTTRRKETNEEILQSSLDRYGFISLRISYSIKDDKGAYRGMKGNSLVIRKIKDPEILKQLMACVEGRIVQFIKEGA